MDGSPKAGPQTWSSSGRFMAERRRQAAAGGSTLAKPTRGQSWFVMRMQQGCVHNPQHDKISKKISKKISRRISLVQVLESS